MSTGGQVLRLSHTSPGASALVVGLLVLGVYMVSRFWSGKQGIPLVPPGVPPPALVPPGVVPPVSLHPAPPPHVLPVTTNAQAAPTTQVVNPQQTSLSPNTPAPSVTSTPPTPATPTGLTPPGPPSDQRESSKNRDKDKDKRPRQHLNTQNPTPGAEDSDSEAPPRAWRKVERKKKEFKKMGMYENLKLWSVRGEKNERFPHPKDIVERLYKAEKLAEVHLWEDDAEHKDQEKHKKLQLEAEKMQHTRFGPIPVYAVKIATQIGAKLTDKEIILIKEHIQQRRNLARNGDESLRSIYNRDLHRSWMAFLNRIGDGDEKLTGENLALGWFNDTFRCVDKRIRMSMNPNHTFPEELKVAGALFGWLEYLGMMAGRQRIISIDGLDLAGLAMRIHCEKQKDNTYRVDVTCWMWGGEGCGETEEEWIGRLRQSDGAIDAARQRLFATLNDSIERRRLVFRPGWPIKSVPTTNDYGTSRKEVEIRTARAEVYESEEAFYQTASKIAVTHLCEVVENLMGRISPSEIVFVNVRQFHWDPQLKPDQNNLSYPNIATALFSCGRYPTERSQGELKKRGEDLDNFGSKAGNINLGLLQGVRFLDLAGFVPLIDKKHHYLLDLKWWPGLRAIYLPYLPSRMKKDKKTGEIYESAIGVTARLLIADKSPLAQFLSSNKESGRSSGVVYIGMGEINPHNLSEDLDLYLRMAITNATKKEPIDRVCTRYKDFVDRHLGNIWTWELTDGKRIRIKPNIDITPASFGEH